MPYAPVSPFRKPKAEADRWRGSASSRGYDRTWEFMRKAFLSRYPCCGDRPHNQPSVMSYCRDKGYITAATQVDHVIPHRGDKGLFYNQDNWQSLCQSCGARKSRAGQ